MKNVYATLGLLMGFLLTIAHPTQSQVLVYEGFDYFNTSTVSLNNINNGKFMGATITNWDKSLGWAGDWQESGGSSTYAISASVSASYTAGQYDLITCGRYAGSGTATSVGRKIQNSPAGPFSLNGTNTSTTNTSNGVNYLTTLGATFTASSYTSTTPSVGADGRTLWLSFLIIKTTNNDNVTYLSLHKNTNTWDGNTNNHIAIGYFGTASNNSGNRYWSIRINGTTTRSNDIVTVNQWTLLVAKIDFKSNSSNPNRVTLYVNPTNIGQNATPVTSNTAVTAASANGTDNSFQSLAYYGGGVVSSVQQSYVDEIRIAASYKSATTASNLIRVEGEVCGGTLGNNIFNNGNFDGYASAPSTFLANISPWNTSGAVRSIDNVAPWTDVTGGTYCYVDNINSVGVGNGPNDGNYTIVNGVRDAWDVWVTSNDYTGSGYMMLVNAAYQPGVFFRQTQTNTFCEQTTYEFSVQVKNVDKTSLLTAYGSSGTTQSGFKPCDPTREPGCEQLSQLDAGTSAITSKNLTQHEQSGATGCNLYDWYISGTADATNINAKSYRVLPEIEFIIGDGSGNDVVAYTPPAPIPNDGLWHKVGFTFTTKTGVNTLELKVRNKAPGGGGNDIALDNFSFRACGPTVSLNMGNFPSCTPATVTSATGTGYVGPNWSTPQYRWMKKTGSGSWVTIPGAPNSPNYTATFPNVLQGDSIRLNIASSTANLGNYNCSVLSNGGRINCTIPLPVTLLSFDVQKITTGVQLNWQTSLEKNSDYFVVERSTDGKSFAPVCQVKAQGNSSHLETYYCYDYAPAAGTNYYRLKSVDFDGQFTYSKVAILQYDQNAANAIVLNPNPAQDDVKVVFTESFDKAEEVTIRITTLAGQLLQKEHRKVDTQTRELKLSTAHLTEGMYLVEVETQNRKYIQKLIIKK